MHTFATWTNDIKAFLYSTDSPRKICIWHQLNILFFFVCSSLLYLSLPFSSPWIFELQLYALLFCCARTEKEYKLSVLKQKINGQRKNLSVQKDGIKWQAPRKKNPAQFKTYSVHGTFIPFAMLCSWFWVWFSWPFQTHTHKNMADQRWAIAHFFLHSVYHFALNVKYDHKWDVIWV